MNVDLTALLEEAAKKEAMWSSAHVAELAGAVAECHVGAHVDWEQGDEEWARVLGPKGIGPIALICKRIPVGFICRGPVPTEPEDFTWLSISSSFSEPVFRVNPTVLEQIFRRAISRNLDYQSLSIQDLWWATV